jgi:hypothetical protein
MMAEGHKSAIAAYGNAVAGIPSQIAFGGCRKISHVAMAVNSALCTQLLLMIATLDHYCLLTTSVVCSPCVGF